MNRFTEVQRVSFVGYTQGVRATVLVCGTYKTYTLYLRMSFAWCKASVSLHWALGF